MHDYPEASVYITPLAFRLIRKKTEVIDDKVTLIADTDDSIVVVVMMMDKPDDMIFYSGDFMNQYHDAANNKKNIVLGHGYFVKLASFEDERYIGRNIGQDDGRACAFRP